MRITSTKMRRRCGAMLLIAAVIGGFAAWIVIETATEPRHNGKTARQWYRQFLKREGSHREFVSALGPLYAEFATVLGRELKRSGSPLDALYFRTYQKLPKSIARIIPAPMTASERQDKASLTLMNLLLAHPEAAPIVARDLPVLEKLLAAPNDSRTLFLIYAAAGNDPMLVRKTANLTHTNFWVRFAAAVYLQDYELRRPNVDVKHYSNAIPVCVETITNAPALAKKYGIIAENYRQRALRLLMRISPETAAEYAAQLK